MEKRRISFGGRCYMVEKIESYSHMLAVRSGRLNHIGSCSEVSQGLHTTPQLYEIPNSSRLLAAAVGLNSQHINMLWHLTPVTQ